MTHSSLKWLVESRLSRTALASISDFKCFSQLPSTQEYLLAGLPLSSSGVRLCLTTNQTQGRGRGAKTWHMPPGKGLALSLAYRSHQSLAQLQPFSLAVGISLLLLLQRLYDLSDLRLKWPNDLYSQGLKWGGILVHTRSVGAQVDIVLGVGLNLYPFNPIGFKSCTDLTTLLMGRGPLMDEPQLIAQIIECLLELLPIFEEKGFASFYPLWPNYDLLYGRWIGLQTFRSGALPLHETGLAQGITPEGLLRVLIDGQERHLHDATISF